MSNQDTLKAHPTHAEEPSDRRALLSAVGWIGVILIFALIVLITYVPTQATDNEEKLAEERLKIRDDVNAEQARLTTTYEWVDQQNGVVRLPIERAMALTVAELQAEGNGGAAE